MIIPFLKKVLRSFGREPDIRSKIMSKCFSHEYKADLEDRLAFVTMSISSGQRRFAYFAREIDNQHLQRAIGDLYAEKARLIIELDALTTFLSE